jgi:hypothetical protein
VRLSIGVLAAVVSSGAAPAGAEPAPVATAIFVDAGDGVDAGARAELARGLERALAANQRIALVELDMILAELGGEVPHDAIAEARALAAAGRTAFEKGATAAAVKKLESAELALEGTIAFVKKNELAEAQFLLGAAYLDDGRREEAEDTFARLLVWRPGWVVDVERFARVLPAWENARRRVEAEGRGSLEIATHPPGATAFVDGRYVGATPARAEALAAGAHYLTFKKDGFRRHVAKVMVDSRREATVAETLAAGAKDPLLAAALERARPDVGKDFASPAVAELRTLLTLDQALFVVAREDGADLVVAAHLYDLRSRLRLSHVANARIPRSGGAPVAELARTLYTGIRYDGRADPAPARDTILSSWWFWTLVGVTVGVAVPLVLYQAGAFDPPAAGNTGAVLLRF